MSVIEQATSTRGIDFWTSVDPENVREVLEAVNEEVQFKSILMTSRTSWLANEVEKDINHLHYFQGKSAILDPVWITLLTRLSGVSSSWQAACSRI
jgi:hypothetical protein